MPPNFEPSSPFGKNLFALNLLPNPENPDDAFPTYALRIPAQAVRPVCGTGGRIEDVRGGIAQEHAPVVGEDFQ